MNAPAPTDADVAIISATTTDTPAREISSDKIVANVRGLRISNVALTDFAATSDAESERVKLLGAENDFLEIGLNATGTTAPDMNTVWQDTLAMTINCIDRHPKNSGKGHMAIT